MIGGPCLGDSSVLESWPVAGLGRSRWPLESLWSISVFPIVVKRTVVTQNETIDLLRLQFFFWFLEKDFFFGSICIWNPGFFIFENI